MSTIAPPRFRFILVILVAIGGMTAMPLLQSVGIAPGVAAAFADDDDDNNDDDDSGDNAGSSGGSSGGENRGDDGRRLRGDLRSLFRWPFQRAERPASPRRAVAIPDRARDEIVALGLDEATIASLTQDGFVIDERTTIALTGSELVKLTIPRGMTLDVARQAVVAAAPQLMWISTISISPRRKTQRPAPAATASLFAISSTGRTKLVTGERQVAALPCRSAWSILPSTPIMPRLPRRLSKCCNWGRHQPQLCGATRHCRCRSPRRLCRQPRSRPDSRRQTGRDRCLPALSQGYRHSRHLRSHTGT